MIVIDIGNTNTVIGIFFNNKLKKIIRFNTNNKNIEKILKENFLLKDSKKYKFDYKLCCISSVSPSFDNKFIFFFKKLKLQVININLKNIPNDINFNYANNQLGADRIANTFAAINKYGSNSIVVDFGTATTFDLVINNNYEGGLITPGISISLNTLIENASKLNYIKIKKVKKIIGNNTKDSLQNGFYWGYVSLINGVIKKIILEYSIKPKIILTGGLSSIFKSEIKFNAYHDPNLTLEGLYLIGKKKYAK